MAKIQQIVRKFGTIIKLVTQNKIYQNTVLLQFSVKVL